MTDRVAELEARVAALGAQVAAQEARLADLERGGRAPAAPAPPVRPVIPRPIGPPTTLLVQLAGRTMLALAGAFALRWITEAGVLRLGPGVGLGLLYALALLALAHRAGPAARWSAAFHGGAAVLVACPLLYEATARFDLLPSAAAAAALGAFTGAALWVAAARRLQALAWVASAGAGAAAVALMVATGRLAPPLLALVALGVATLWLGYVRDWFALRWPAALLVDLLALVLSVAAGRGAGADGWRAALIVDLALLAGYLGSTAARTLVLRRAVVPFELAQTAAALAVGLGGAAYVTAGAGHGAGAVGAAALALAAGAYAAGFAFLHRRGPARNVHFYGAVGLVLATIGAGLALPSPALAWAALAVAAAALYRTTTRRSLELHALAYALAALVGSGLAGTALAALVRPVGEGWPAPGRPAVVTLGALALVAALTAPAPAAAVRRPARAVLLGALALGGGGALLAWALPRLGDAPGLAATLRTANLAGTAVLAAWVGQRARWREASWLAYPLLAAAGLELLLDAVPRARPATLGAALALYGAALIAVPRLRRREAPPAAAAAPSPAPPRPAEGAAPRRR